MSEQPITSPEETQTNTTTEQITKKSFLVPLAIFGAGCVIGAAVLLVFAPFLQNVISPDDSSVDMEEFESWRTSLGDQTTKEVANERITSLPLDETDYSIYYKNIPKQAGVEWFLHPVLMDDLELLTYIQPGGYSTDDSYSPEPISYFQVGTLNSEPIIYTEMPCDGMGCPSGEYAFFVGSTTATAMLVSSHTTYSFDPDYSLYKVNTPILRNDTLLFKALQFKAVSINKAQLNPGSRLFYFRKSSLFAESRFNTTEKDTEDFYENIEFLEDTEYGPLFRGYNLNDNSTATFDYAIRAVGGILIPYELFPEFFSDDRVPNITWYDGTKNETMYRMDGLGSCGGGGPEIAVKGIPESDLKAVGKASTGETIYNVTNPESIFIKRVFDATGGRVYDYDQDTGESRSYTITPNEFIAKHGVIIWIDALGYQNILTNGDYGPQAECAKPVIYLYPEETTEITVQVDALVTKSDPLYETGWTVEADPSGELVHNGKTYTSLFWDGYGNGAYPELTEGFVVKTENALSVMAEHLAYMGFNETEISEFSDFWQPHLPTEPYTKFSWIQTGGMEHLAKLKIVPPPRTLIRAFVDFVGISQPETIIEQKLESQKRIGYTATEWGGILRK